MGPSGMTQTHGDASSSSVAGQIVPADPADTLAQDLSMVSSLEDFLEESIVPISTTLVLGSESGTKVLASSSDTPQSDSTKKGTVAKTVSKSTSKSSSSGTKVLAPKGSSSSSIDAIVAADVVTDLAEENARLRKALEAKDIELFETKIHAENYASQALQDSRSRAEQALAYQKGTFEQAHEEYSLTLKDMHEAQVAQSTANLEAIANTVIGQQQNELHTASIMVAKLQLALYLVIPAHSETGPGQDAVED